jgi:hypothetical protein
MQSRIIGLLAAEGSREATLLVRRGDGQFALARIDARVASAARLAAPFARTVENASLTEAYTVKN